MENLVLVEIHRGNLIILSEPDMDVSMVAENQKDLGEQIFIKNDGQDPFRLPKIREEIGAVLDIIAGHHYVLRGAKLLASNELFLLSEEFVPAKVREIFKYHTILGEVTRVLVFELPNGHRVWVNYDFCCLYENIIQYL